MESKKRSKVKYCNPSVRSAKCCADLKAKKDTYTGKKLTDTQAAWRAGYLQSQRDGMEAYKRSKEFYKGKDVKSVKETKRAFSNKRRSRIGKIINGELKTCN